MADQPILVINAGSSSLKFGMYVERNGDEQMLLDGLADGVGRAQGKLELKQADGRTLRTEDRTFRSQGEALEEAVRWLGECSPARPGAIGHRVVHGGPRLTTHQPITAAVLQELRACVHFAPLHLPVNIELIEQAERSYAGVPQFACFDTAFHRDMPEQAARFPLPNDLFAQGIRRYGFHGLSYASIVHQLGSLLPSRTVMAHLGGGASLAAVKDGRSVDTSMGLTPTGGIPMATRSGDLDPGVLLYLLRTQKLDVDRLEGLLNHESGMKALSGGRSDMRDLEAAADAGDGEAQLALEVFSTAVASFVAAYAVVLGGLELLVFSGGIGEHSARTRTMVSSKLAFFGVVIDNHLNQEGQGRISSDTSRVEVRVVPSEEDKQIARHCRKMMAAQAGGGS